MSKRDRYLKQRLDELFSPASEPAETQPEEPAAEPEAAPSRSGRPVEQAAATAPERPYLKDLIDQLPLPAYLKDREHTWVAVNAAFAQLIGCTQEMLLGHADKEQADGAWQLDDRVLDTGQPEVTEESLLLPAGKICTRRTRPILSMRRDTASSHPCRRKS